MSADLVRQVKHAAVDEGSSLSQYVEQLLRAGMAAREEGEQDR